MKFTRKGIGWLIFGVIICMTVTESHSADDILSTLALGLVFILIYLMKQRFDPEGIGWFIAGGLLGAFCIDQAIVIIGEAFSGSSAVREDLSELLLSLVLAGVFFFIFYKKNQFDIDNAAYEAGMTDYPQDEYTHDEEEESPGTEEESAAGTAEGTAPERNEATVEFEFESGDKAE